MVISMVGVPDRMQDTRDLLNAWVESVPDYAIFLRWKGRKY